LGLQTVTKALVWRFMVAHPPVLGISSPAVGLAAMKSTMTCRSAMTLRGYMVERQSVIVYL